MRIYSSTEINVLETVIIKMKINVLLTDYMNQ